MPGLSPAIAENARKNERAILQAFSRLSQSKVAELMGVSDTKVSRYKGPDLEEIGALLAACGLQVVELTAGMYDHDVVAALVTLNKWQMQRVQGPEDFVCR